MTIGVLALQGAFAKHLEMLEKCGVNGIPIRFAQEIDTIDGLIIPGGESTTVGKLMARYGIDKKVIDKAKNGMPIFGTCTGMILLSRDIVGSAQQRLGLMDMSVLRNAFGRQVDSFESDLTINGIEGGAFRAIFIRAPYAVESGKCTETLASCEGNPVLLKEGNLLGCAFHPELTDDTRVHMLFIDLVRDYVRAGKRR
ncbi:MAG: pyridoxal 5'-phosphate synthase glutaminase subunit PdxT [Armatimonadota bacterium]